MDIRHTPRIYVNTALAQGADIVPEAEQSHYLLHVLRLKSGDNVRLFNGLHGEWRGTVSSLSKRAITLNIKEQTREQYAEPNVWLCAAPIKKAHFEYMIEKATELGVTTIQPILTSRTQIREVNLDRCRMIAIEAAEQSDRLTIPEIRAPLKLDALIKAWAASRQMIVCAEWGDAAAIGSTLSPTAEAAILTGPEGGLAADELEALRSLPKAVFVRLGPRILRADTAALAALANWQALCGDWRK